MNVLILVLSARREPWGALLDCSLETWDSEDHPQTRTLYYCGKSESTICGLCGGTGSTVYDIAPDEDGVVTCDRCGGTGQGDPSTYNVFYSPQFNEELEHVTPRTMEAFEKSLEYEWDFMARPNSSCYVHKRNLVKFCHGLARENVISGILTGGERSFLWGGCQYIFSRDVIERMVANKDKWQQNEMDDVAITYLARELGIHLRSNGWCASINMQSDGSYLVLLYGNGQNFTFSNWDDINRADGHFFFRVKQDLRRHEDLMIMRQLHKHLR